MPILRIKSWATGETLNAFDLNNEIDNIADQVLLAASQSDVNVGVSTTMCLTPFHNKIALGTLTASTSGTSVTFSSIPSGVRRVTIMVSGMSTSGTSNVMVQIGDAGGWKRPDT